MKRKTLLMVLILCIGMMLFSTAAFAVGELEIGSGVNNHNIYANGNAIIIEKVSDTYPLLSNIYLDKGVIGTYEDVTDTIVDLFSLGLIPDSGGYDLSNYNIYGGRGTVAALVGNTQITMLGGKVQNLMGGGKLYPVTGDTYVTMRGGQANSVFGGSVDTDVNGNTNVTISGGTVWGVYGGSGSGDVTGHTNITISGGTFTVVYGGTNSANDPATTQSTNIIISGGTFSSVYGGGEYSGGTNVNGNTNITISAGTFNGIIHGGTWAGDIIGSTNVTISGGTFADTIYGGSRSGNISGSTNVTISGGTLTGVNGRYSIGGTITGSRNIRISGGSINSTVTGYTAGKLTKTDGTTPVYKTTLTLLGISAITDVSGGSLTLGGAAASGYGLTDVKTTDAGLLTFYLPTGAATAAYAPNNYAVTVVNNDSNAFATVSSNAGLTTVAALTDATPGPQSGADSDNAIAWEVNVANAKSTLALGDIAVAENATFKLYSNAAFTTEITGADTLPLAVGDTLAYIKVTAQDTTTVKYYAVTITRAADTTAPLVTSVSVPSNGTYTNGQNLDFTVNFSEPVTVFGGIPYLNINIGGSVIIVIYESGSGTSALVFRYTIVNKNDFDGIEVNSPIEANGSTIRDAALNDITNWALVGVGSTTNVLVDCTAPILSATSSSSVTATSAGINFASDEAGTYYYLLYAAAEAAPSAATVKAQGVAVKKGTAAALAAANSASISGLTASTPYKAYVIVEDAVGNKSEVSTITFTTAAAPVQATPTFSPGAGAIAFGSTVTISSAEADAIYYTTNGTDPASSVGGATSEYVGALTIDAAKTIKAIAVKAGMTNSAIGSAAYTQAAATAPSAIVLAGGSANPVGGVTNVVIPAAGATDTTGAITGWVTGTNDKIKLTVTEAGGTSAITINGAAYTSGADYTIAAASDLTIVVTTTEAGKVTGVRTFTVSVAAAAIQATPTFSPGAGAIAYGSTVTISSAGADAIYYTTNGTDPTTASTNATTPLVINAPVTVKALAVKAGMTNSAIGSAAYTQAAATAPSAIVLAGGSANPVGGVTNVVIPAAGATDTTGAITGWVTGTNDKIKLTVTEAGGTSAITINGAAYTSGADYTIAAAGDLTIVVTTTEAGKVTQVRTFTVSVAAAAVQATPTFSPGAGAIAYGSTVTISSAGADAIYYTINGTDPTTASTNQADTALVINSAVTVKAIAVKAGMTNSAIGSAAYTQAASANLTGLVFGVTPGNYTFDGGTYNYEGVTLPNNIISTTVIPTGAGTITVEGTVVASGAVSGAIDFSAGVEKTVTVIATETGKTPKTYIIKVTRAVAPTYTITAIADQTMTAVTAGYGAGTQETKTLTITRTGTGDLSSVATALSGANAGSFTITQPLITTLNDGTSSTTFTIKANNGLAAGNYTATVTVSATNMTNVTFTVTQVVNAASGGGGSGGGDSGGDSTPSPTPAATILNDITTPDEQKLETSLQQTGEAKIELASTATGQANITGNVIGQLSQLQKPLNIAGQGVSLQFAPESLQTSQISGQNNNATVQIGAAAVTTQEQQEILAATPLGQSTGVFQVGGQVFNFTAQLSTTSSSGSTSTESITSFAEPVAVTIDLSGLSLTPEQISQLTGTRLEKNEQGEIVPVFLGGTYDPVNKTFTFYTDKFSLYTVLQKDGIVIMNLTIGNTITKLNGAVKTIDVPPSLINNRTFVPLRFIGEALGASFDWNDKTKTVTFQCGAEKLALTVGTTIPGMDTPPTIVNGRTMVPLRYISETFGAQVMWFPASRSVSVVK